MAPLELLELDRGKTWLSVTREARDTQERPQPALPSTEAWTRKEPW